MADSAAVRKALARVEWEIDQLLFRLGKIKASYVKQGLRSEWNKKRASLTRPLYGLLERRWALHLLRHTASTEVLVNAKVVGILLPETIKGVKIPPASRLISTDVMTPDGLLMPRRTYDVFQYDRTHPNTQPYELKSDPLKRGKGVLAGSVEGGVTRGDMAAHFRPKSTPAKQNLSDKRLIFQTTNIPGSKIALLGEDLLSGRKVPLAIDPLGLNVPRFVDYEALTDVLVIGKPDPALTTIDPDLEEKQRKEQRDEKRKKEKEEKRQEKQKQKEEKERKQKEKKDKKSSSRSPDAKDSDKKQGRSTRKSTLKPSADPADAAGKDATDKKSRRTKADSKSKVDRKLDRGVTKPSPNAPVGGGADKAPTKKEPGQRKSKSDAKTRGTDNRGVTDPSPNASRQGAADQPGTAKKPAVQEPVAGSKAGARGGTDSGKSSTTGVDAPDARKVQAKSDLPAKSPSTPPTPEPAPHATKAAPSPAVDAPTRPGRGKLELSLRVHPKLKAVGGFIITIGFSILSSIGESKRIAEEIGDAVKENAAKFNDIVNSAAVQEDFVRFRYGSSMERGYQLYFRIEIALVRSCSDGGCGTNGVIKKIRFKEVTYTRNKGRDFVPQADGQKGWIGNNATAIVYQPIFAHGELIDSATEDAAEGKLAGFEQVFIQRQRRAGDSNPGYFDAFKKYCKLYPDSPAAKLFQRFAQDKYLVDITDVDFGRKSPHALMGPPHGRSFEDVLKQVRWGLAVQISFIRDYYDYVIQLPPDDAIPLLDRYDVWFRKLDDAARACQSSCHRLTGNRSTFNRLTADELRQRQSMNMMNRGTRFFRLESVR